MTSRFLMMVLLLVLVAGNARATASLPEENAKYQAVKRVYDKVARAFGDGRVAPRLIVSPVGAGTRKAVAWSDAGTEGAIGIEAENAPLQEGYIAIEERIYDIFSSLNAERDDALAFLLGHELTHYYMRHGWVGDFGNSFASLEVGRKMIKAASYEDTIKRETEADYFGGFYGYLAGYDTLGIAPRALDLIYAEYRLPDKLSNYPSRTERKTIAERAEGNLKKMVPVFESASKLLLLERYPEAARLFEQLAHTFPSREMFNNAGVAYTLEALKLSKPGSVPFAFPIEFDAETRLMGKGRRMKGLPDQFSQRRAALLQRAADNLDKAMQRDRGYGVSYVNLAAVDVLLGDRDNAVILANRGIELAKGDNDTATLSNALCVRGIAYAEGGNKEKGMVDMAAARNLGNPAAAVNVAILHGEAWKETPAKGGREAAGHAEEKIGGISPRDAFTRNRDTTTYALKGVDRDDAPITIHARQGKGWRNILVAIGGRPIQVVETEKGYPEATSRGIRLGAVADEVRQKYGTTPQVVLSRQQEYWIFKDAGIIFSMGREGKVNGWMLFAAN